MGTRWRGLLAPINQPTGDGRRMAPGAFTNRPLPLPLKWQRTDEGGHTTSVVVGSMDRLDIGDDAVWGEGELFDDVSPSAMPRLAEDVAEAKELLARKVIGPSVDPGSAQAVTVMKGGSDPLDDQKIEQYWMRYGKLPETELLFTGYEIAAATLVPVPAFAECRPFELLDSSGEPMGEAARSLVAAAPLPALDPALFRDPQLETWTAATMVDLGNGWTHVFGHVATHDVCHVGMRGVCTTAPYSDQDYVPFHRYSVTSGGHELPVMAGRLTTGLGKLEGRCRCHPGNDDHACGNLSFGGAVAHHDQMEALAYVCVGEDEANNAIWFSGVLNPEASEQARKVLGRRRVSGDWREYGASMELVEVLVLARREPGFPLPRVSMENGRQLSLTAAGVIMPERPAVDEFTNAVPDGWSAGSDAADGGIDYDRLGSIVAQKLMEAASGAADEGGEELCSDEDELCGDHLDEVAVTAASSEGGHTGGMVALRMSDADAARLAVDGGLPADELHMTLAYLGEAADITPEARERMLKSMGRIAAKVGQPIDAEGFSVNAFNPGDANDRPTAIVMGINGAMLGDLRAGVCKALGNCEGFDMPEQHEPWAAHATLAYDDDLAKVAEYADRVGPLTFDRIRVAFGDDVTDIPLGDIIAADEVEQVERDDDDAMYARMARANQLAAQVRFAVDSARQARVAELGATIKVAALAATH